MPEPEWPVIARKSPRRWRTAPTAPIRDQEPVPGPSTEVFAQIAKKRNLWVGVGLAERSADPKKPYNTIAFVGPRPDILDLFGDKASARQHAERLGVLVLPGQFSLAHADAAFDAENGTLKSPARLHALVLELMNTTTALARPAERT